MAKTNTTKNKTAAKKITTKKTVVKKAQPKKIVAKKTSAKATTKAVPKNSAAKKKTATSKSRKTAAVKSTSKTKTGRDVEVISKVTKTKKTIKGYNKKELAGFKAVIVEKRTEIIEQLQNLKDQMMDSTTGQYVNENSPYSLHMAEQGTDAQEREKLYLWAQRETKFLGYLEDALERIENGTYGVCIGSLELPEGPHLIPKNRLLAVPHTSHCVACKNKKK